jgi:hypothetical protein
MRSLRRYFSKFSLHKITGKEHRTTGKRTQGLLASKTDVFYSEPSPHGFNQIHSLPGDGSEPYVTVHGAWTYRGNFLSRDDKSVEKNYSARHLPPHSAFA